MCLSPLFIYGANIGGTVLYDHFDNIFTSRSLLFLAITDRR